MDDAETLRQLGQARRLAQAVLAQPDDAACDACLDRLEAYVDDQLSGAEYAANWPEVALHLDSCVACAEAYGLLFEQRQSEIALEPAEIPTPDLSFLQPNAAGPIGPAQLRALRRVERLRAVLAAAVSYAGATLHVAFSQALLGLLPALAQPGLAFRDGAETLAPLFELTLDAPGGQIARLQLSAYVDHANPKRCAVRVQVGLHEREWPDLAGVPVSLAFGGERRQAATDAWGEALFADLPTLALPELQVAVEA
jgi:hypothetical protein